MFTTSLQEATGLNVSRDRIVEIAAIKLMPDGQRICKGPQRLNPTVTMTADVIDVHGISNDDVAGAPKFADVAKEWLEFLAGCDLHGYNAAKFDVPLLRWVGGWVGRWVGGWVGGRVGRWQPSLLVICMQ